MLNLPSTNTMASILYITTNNTSSNGQNVVIFAASGNSMSGCIGQDEL
uniref:Uncharacterized protein n=1 Tax=Anguilla anguilla TaxID=7936 RepID=A0A0E9QF66_ANGAN